MGAMAFEEKIYDGHSDGKAFLELISKYQDQEKAKPLIRKQGTESGAEDEHRLNQ